MRPEFELVVELAPEAFMHRLRVQLTETNLCEGNVFRRHAMLQHREDLRTFWSPYLNLELVDRDDGSLVRGRFSPHPSVWTGFMAIYGTLAAAAIAGLVYGVSQSMLDRTPWALAIVPAAMAVAAFVYGAAFIGQGLGSEQMYELRALVDRAADPIKPTLACAG